MKFTNNFTSLLKDISYINEQMMFVEGQKQSISSKLDGILAIINTDVYIDKSFAINDISKFLNVLNTFEEPEVEITNKTITFSDSYKNAKLQLTNPEFISYNKNPSRYETLSKDISFNMSHERFLEIYKLSLTLKANEFIFEGDGENVTLTVKISDNNENSAKMNLDKSSDKFKIFIKLDKLKLSQNDYVVGIHKKGALIFESPSVSYFIAFDREKSSFGD